MSTATVTSAPVAALDVLREQMRAIHHVLRLNADGISQEDSLLQPQPGGNCFNWNVGHLVLTNELTLKLLGQPPVLGEEALQRYARGSARLRRADEAMPLEKLLAAWDEGCAGIGQGLAKLNPERLAEPAPFSPRNNPDETVGTLLSILMFHQAAHTGQTSLLRCMAGKPGAIR
jgi:hypothetical protein